MLLATLCLAACEAFVGEGPQAPVKQESANDAGPEPAAPSMPWGGNGAAKPNDPPPAAADQNRKSTTTRRQQRPPTSNNPLQQRPRRDGVLHGTAKSPGHADDVLQ
jgi:hypothetical protein